MIMFLGDIEENITTEVGILFQHRGYSEY